jgi:hypothetical protein
VRQKGLLSTNLIFNQSPSGSEHSLSEPAAGLQRTKLVVVTIVWGMRTCIEQSGSAVPSEETPLGSFGVFPRPDTSIRDFT